MTEAEWMACADPAPMLDFQCGKASERKARLFACACCRRRPDLTADISYWDAIEVAERFADGLAPKDQLAAVYYALAADAPPILVQDWPNDPRDLAAYAACAAVQEDIFGPSAMTGAPAVYTPALFAAMDASGSLKLDPVEVAFQATLLRDVIGNPFRPIPLDSSWLAWNDSAIRKMAQAIYDDRAFDSLPILADALEDAGCTDADILGHCREPGEHVRGCWVVDLLLGKE